MRKILTYHLVLFLLLVSTSLNAQAKRQKIGYAFGGGGAKGLAEIGVLRVLEEAGIRPDYITGTSIGSIVGGLYAIGYSVEELEELANTLEWEYYFNDELNRTDLPIEERGNSDRYQLKLNIEDGKISIPKGFVQGQKIGLLLSQLTLPVHGINDFDDFNIPFRCVAADFETGEAVVLGEGSLAKSIRASMSIPSVFEPVEIDGKLLIDGGVVRNLPVQEVKEMGADIIIAIDVTSPLYKKTELSSFLTVLEQAGSYRLVESLKEAKKLADVFIHPAIDQFGALDFTNNDTLMFLGEKAAREKLPEILALINSNGKDTLTRRAIDMPESYEINNIYVKGISKESQQLSDKIGRVSSKRGISIKKVEDRIKVLFGSNYIKDAYYEVTADEEGGYDLDIDANLQSGQYVQVSANYDSDLKAALLFNLTYRNKGMKGAKFSTDLKLSEHPLFLAEYLIHTNTNPNFGISINSRLNHYPAFYYNEEGDLDESFKINHYSLGLDVSSSINNDSKVSAGIGIERYSQRLKLFEGSTEDLQLNQVEVHLGYLWDSYDQVSFPTSGSFLSFKSKFSFAGNLKESNEDLQSNLSAFNKLVRFQFNKVLPIGEGLALKWYNDAGWLDFEKDNFLSLFYLGRALPGELTHVEFVGLDYMELGVTSYVLSGIKLRIETKENVFASLLFNYGYYKTKEYLRIIDKSSFLTSSINEKIIGLGAEIGFITPLGPGKMTAEYNLEKSRANFSLHLGYLF